MSLWQKFLEDIDAINPFASHPAKPGKVMICFMNRYLEGLDDVKYRFIYDGKTVEGKTSEKDYCFELTPKTTQPIEVYVWSQIHKVYKRLDDVHPKFGKKVLARKIIKTIKVNGSTRPHKDENTNKSVPRKSDPTKAAPAGPSPEGKQGVDATPKKDEQNKPIDQVKRPVPDRVTKDQLKKIFPQARDDYLQEIADEVNTDLTKYKLDTVYRRSHFFAQIRAETGPAMKPETESWEYPPEFLLTFSYYKSHPEEAKSDGYERAPSTKDKSGREVKGKIIRHANQDAIGKKHFSKFNGNRSDHPEDGSNFRGRGLIQITGYEKYNGFMTEYSQYFSGNAPDLVNSPNIVNQTPYAIRSAIWFWVTRKGYEIADKKNGKEDVKELTLRVNGGYNGLSERTRAYSIAELSFK